MPYLKSKKRNRANFILLTKLEIHLGSGTEELNYDISDANTKPTELLQEHIKRLKRYNELKDTSLGLLGLISQDKGCKIKEVVEEMGFDIND